VSVEDAEKGEEAHVATKEVEGITLIKRVGNVFVRVKGK
jgi:hypothetical protein